MQATLSPFWSLYVVQPDLNDVLLQCLSGDNAFVYFLLYMMDTPETPVSNGNNRY